MTKPESKSKNIEENNKKGKELVELQKKELSEEDKQLKEEIQLIVDKLHEPSKFKTALDALKKKLLVKGSVTQIPKPLKFLREHYETLCKLHKTLEEGNDKVIFSDVMSLVAMISQKEGDRDSLEFKLSGDLKEITLWGHEYIKFLSGQIGEEYQIDGKNKNKLQALIDLIVPFEMKANREPAACDLLFEVDQLPTIQKFCDKRNYSRVCLYLITLSKYTLHPENIGILKLAHNIYVANQKYPEALQIAFMINDRKLVEKTFLTCKDKTVRRQMAFMLANQRIKVNLEEEEDVEEDGDEEDIPDIDDIMSNTLLSSNFMYLAKELDFLEPKLPEDIYKSYDENRSTLQKNMDSARKNLSYSFVNGLINCGFSNDKLLVKEGEKWIHRNKDHGMMSATASYGLIYLWDSDIGLNVLDKFIYNKDPFIKAGALLGQGIISTGLQNGSALELLSEYVEGKTRDERIGAILGLGIAYAGQANVEVQKLLTQILCDSDESIEILAFTALSLGLVFAGTCNEDISESIINILLELGGEGGEEEEMSEKKEEKKEENKDEKKEEKKEEKKDDPNSKINHKLIKVLSLGLGLLFLGKQDSIDAILEASKVINDAIKKQVTVTITTCAYAGTGNVHQVQKLLKICGEHPKKDEISNHQDVAVLGIALIAMGEELGSKMAVRALNHLLQYGDLNVKRAVPLALGLLHISNPVLTIMDTLSKLSHDGDAQISQGAILALGLIGAGSNNARIAQLLRQLAVYYTKDPNQLFIVRIAQGFVFLGKGLMTLSPYHSERSVSSPSSLAGLLVLLYSALDMKDVLLGKYHYLLYCVATAIRPRYLLTLGENLKPINTEVRVGTAVDTVAQAGRPKTITGFQTHKSPVLLQYTDRAELSTKKYIPCTSVLEDVVILRNNKNYQEEEQ